MNKLRKKQSYHIIKEGYLFKESYHFKQLRKRWIVLNKQYIDCYKDNTSDHTTEELDLATFEDVRPCIDQINPYEFELVPNDMNCNKPTRVFVASSKQEMNEWMTKMKQCITGIELEDTNIKNAEEWNSDLMNLSLVCGSEHKSVEISVSSLNANRFPNANAVESQQYTESDIQQLSVWFTKEIKKLELQHHKEKDNLLSRIDELMHKLNDSKRIMSNDDEIQIQLQQLSTKKDEEYKSHIDTLKKERDALKNEIQFMHEKDKRMDINIDEEKTKQCNDCKPNDDDIRKRGLLIFQQRRITVQQLYHMASYFRARAMWKAPKIIFGDNDIIEEYDKHICYKIRTTFYEDTPTLYDFRVLMNKEFDVLQQYLMDGHDVIVPLPSKKDMEINGNKRFYKNKKQIIYHRVGINKELNLPILFIEFIQNKIDQLTKYCSCTQIVQYYVYDKVNYKAFTNPESMHRKPNKVETERKSVVVNVNKRVIVTSYIWQWRNSHNQWIAYDDKTCKKINDLPVNGLYEYNANSFITKISIETGIEVDTNTEHKRDVKRIAKQKK